MSHRWNTPHPSPATALPVLTRPEGAQGVRHTLKLTLLCSSCPKGVTRPT